MHGPWTHIKAHIYDMERERGQRSVALRRTFNRGHITSHTRERPNFYHR